MGIAVGIDFSWIFFDFWRQVGPKLVSQIDNKSIRKGIKKMRKHVVEQPSREPDGLQAASALAATWWQLNRENSEEELNHARDSRFASRLRGALASLRAEHGNEAVLLVPIQQAWRSAMLTALESLPDAESSSHDAPSDEEEEE